MSGKNSFVRCVYKVACLLVLLPIIFVFSGCGELDLQKLEKKLDSSYFEPLVADGMADSMLDKFYSLEHEFESLITMPYRIHIPTAYKSSGEGLPLVVFLHGAGGRGYNNVTNVAYNTLFSQLIYDYGLSSDCPAVLLAPQCPPNGSWGAIVSEVNTLVKMVVKKLNIDKDRVYVTGLSMGGHGTFSVIADEPELYAAAMPICGWTNTTSIATLIKDIPIWVFHAADDGTVAVSGSRNIVNAIKKAGGTKVIYTEYETGNHGIWGTVYSDHKHIKWLFEQVKGK